MGVVLIDLLMLDLTVCCWVCCALCCMILSLCRVLCCVRALLGIHDAVGAVWYVAAPGVWSA